MRLPGRLTGTSQLVPWLNTLLDGIRAGQIKPGLGYRVRQSTDGVVLESFGGGGGSGGGIKQYRIKSVYGDYVICREWDGENEGTEDVKIAKPFKLRHSITTATLDGAVVNYTYAALANNLDGTRLATPTSGTAETQLVVPRWLVNDLIYATESDFTGVEVNGEKLTFIDINADARAWCKKYVA